MSETSVSKTSVPKTRQQLFETLKPLTQTATPEQIQQEADALLLDNPDVRQRLFADSAADAFIERIRQGKVIGTTCEQLDSLAELPDNVMAQLNVWQQSSEVAVQPHNDLQSLDWSGFKTGIDIKEEGSVSVIMADYAIAETGSVVIHSSPEMPVLMSFLPLHQIIVVRRNRILSYLEDYSTIAKAQSLSPRNTILITGASGTTDIEGVLVQGAHGPKLVHIIVV